MQKLPELLDEPHLLIEEDGIRFLLTGSSARKIRHAGTNLLGGRARTRYFHPFSYVELREHDFSLERMFTTGMIPSHYFSSSPEEDLAAYVGQYLTEEIAAEGIVRSISAFSRFLHVAAAASGQLVNYSSLANDAQMPRQTLQSYFQILIDTLLGFEIEAYRATEKRKPITTAKFYLFDVGVVRVLRGLDKVQRNSKDFGDFFEHFIALELIAFRDYRLPQEALNFWRSKSGFEVDFILGDKLAIEVKSTARPTSTDNKGLRALREERPHLRPLIVCQSEKAVMVDETLCLPWRDFLDRLWAGEFT